MAVKKPKFKVGDPIVFMHAEQPVYMLVYNMSYQQKMWMYNILVTGAFYPEDSIRAATEKEKKVYFSTLTLGK